MGATPPVGRRCDGRWRNVTVMRWLLLLLISSPLAAATAPVPAWNYYNSPPFLTAPDSHQGLAHDVVTFLNRRLSPPHQLSLQQLPRARLNRMLKSGDSGVVLLVPKLAFEGSGLSVRWTAPLFRDRQLLISSAAAAIDYRGPASLAGLRFGCIPGRSHPKVQTQIDAGKVHCEMAPNEPAMLKMLANQRIDAISLPASIFAGEMRYMPDLRDRLYVSRQDLGAFDRHLMLTADLAPLHGELERVIRTLSADAAWRALLAQYGLEPAIVL